MRTIDATLTAALAAGTGTPYLKAYVGYSNGSVKSSHTDVWAYRLTGQTLEFWVPSIANLASDQEQIWLERGLTIAGTNYTLTTGRFWIWEEEYLPNRVTRFKGGIVPHEYYADSLTTETYETVIDALFAAFGKTTTYKDDTEAWLDYQFLPNPTELSITDAERVMPLLAQKRLIGVCDNGAEDVRIFCCDVLGSSVATITAADEYSLFTTKQRTRQYLWKDELGAYHQDGDATDPVHNLGFMMSTDSPPARNSQTFQFKGYVRPDLRLQDGDTIRMSLYGGTATATFFGKVTEEFSRRGSPFIPSPGHMPPWRCILEAWPIFGNTEGGDLPQNVANKVNHAYINVSEFDNVLSQNETNIQAALDVLDDHHIGGFTREVLGANRTIYVRANIGDCTISNASPAVVTLNGHGLSNGDRAIFRTSGALPTGLTVGVEYYVINRTTNTFQVSLTDGGAAINTSSAGSGTHSLATGSDSFDGTAADKDHALLSIQAASNKVGALDARTYSLTVTVAKSHYLEGGAAITLKDPIGSANVNYTGDTSTPSNVTVDAGWYKPTAGPINVLKGFRMRKTSTASSYAIWAGPNAFIQYGNMDFSTGWSVHVLALGPGTVEIVTSYEITGGATRHFYAISQGFIRPAVGGITITVTGTPAFTAYFADAIMLGLIRCQSSDVTFSGGATGVRYNGTSNAVLYTGGAGANYFPGNVAGAVATGAQYI